jgi:LuxR family maltose regulon positive regulatory protein
MHRQGGSTYHKLFGTILATQAAWANGNHKDALESLQSAIALARPHDLVQPFIDEGAAFAATVRAIVRRFGLNIFSADATGFISRVLGSAIGRSRHPFAQKKPRTNGAGAWPQEADGLLSPREHEALRLLSEGKSNKELARELDLSEATIKFHLKNLYSKLGVGRRAMALAVANRLNLN